MIVLTASSKTFSDRSVEIAIKTPNIAVFAAFPTPCSFAIFKAGTPIALTSSGASNSPISVS